MKKIGETIQLLRKQKRLTQKDVYEGIVTRNFASRFENGRSNIEANKLFLILKRLDVSANEFQYIHYQMGDYQYKRIIKEIDDISVKKDYQKLQTIYEKFHSDISLDKQVIAAIAYVKIYVHENNPLKMSLTPTYPLRVHLLESKNWSLFELRAFVDGIFIFRQDNFELDLCLDKAITAFTKYYEFIDSRLEVEQSMASIILNYLQIVLTNQRYQSMNTYHKLMAAVSNELEDFTAKVTIQFSGLLFNLYFGENIKQTMIECHHFLESLRSLGFSDTSVFKSIYDYHLPICEERELKRFDR